MPDSFSVPPAPEPLDLASFSEAPPWGVALAKSVYAMGCNLGALAHHVSVQNGRVGSIESRLNDTSSVAQAGSDHSMEQAAALASEATARKTNEVAIDERIKRIEAKTDLQTTMLTKAAALSKDPKVIAILIVLWTVFQKWAEKHGYL